MIKHISVGRGPNKVLVLHGWFGSAEAWRPIFPALDTERFTYAFMDYRGYGERGDEIGEYTIEEIARDALALADQLGWDKFNLVGHSMGGKAVQRVLANAPQRVRRIVAITPVPASGVKFDEATWTFFSSAATEAQVRHAIIFNTTGARLSRAWVGGLVKHSLENSRHEAFASYLRAWANGDFTAEINGNPVCMQVIVGEHDTALTEELMRQTYLRCYPNAELVVMKNAGHYPMDETPVSLATTFEEFLAR